MTNKFRLFVDMDGVLAKFNNTISSMEVLYEEGYYRNLLPQQEVIEAVKNLAAEYPENIYIASAVLDSPYARQEKIEWLHEYLPDLKDNQIIFTEYGRNKAEFIPDGICASDYLLDDYTNNLKQWKELGGSGIKLINNINNTNKTWFGNSVRYDQDYTALADTIKKVITNKTASVYMWTPKQVNDLEKSLNKVFFTDPDKINADSGYIYKTVIPTCKGICSDHISLTKRDIAELCTLLFPDSEAGRAAVQKLKHLNSDVDIITEIAKDAIQQKKINDVLRKLGYDHIHMQDTNGNHRYKLLSDNKLTIEGSYTCGKNALTPMTEHINAKVVIDVNYAGSDLESIQNETYQLNRIFKDSLSMPESMPEIRVNLKIDGEDVLKNDNISLRDLQQHKETIDKRMYSSLIEILKDKAAAALNFSALEKFNTLYDKIIQEEIQIMEISIGT